MSSNPQKADETSQAPARAGGGAFAKPLLLTAVFGAVLLVLILHHVLWRDEMQAWDIVRVNQHFDALLIAMRFEGHPPIWFLLLKIVQYFTTSMTGMKLLHAGLATATVAVVAFKSPWNTLQKTLFAFGYYPLFEYGILSRNYAAGILLAFIACALLCGKEFRPIRLGIVIFLLGQTNAYAMIISIALTFAAVVEWKSRRKSGELTTSGKAMAMMVVIVLAGIVLYAIELWQPAQSGVAETWEPHASAFANVFRALVPIPDQSLHFWNTNVLDDYPVMQWMAAGAVLLVALWIAGKGPSGAALFIVGADGLLLFMYLKYPGFLRHQGHLFILLLMSDWINRSGAQWPAKSFTLAKWRCGTLTGILALQAAVGIFAVYRDWVMPFSASQETAEYITAHFPGIPIVGDRDDATSAVAMRLNRQIYFMEGHRLGTYIVSDRGRWDPITMKDVFDVAHQMADGRPFQFNGISQRMVRIQPTDVLVIISLVRAANIAPAEIPLGEKIIWKSSDATEADEVYELVLIHPGSE